MDFKWGRSQKKTEALAPRIIKISVEIQWEIEVRDKKLKI
jgi:hypothetical protein